MKKNLVLAVGCALLLASTAQAALITSTTRAPVLSDGTVLGSFDSLRTGQVSTPDEASILIFALPTLASNEVFDSASFSINANDAARFSGALGTDLYAVDTRATSTIVAADFFAGANDASATKLMDDFATGATPSSAAGIVVDSGNLASLVSWLNSHYTAGAPDLPFAAIRLNANQAQPGGFTFQRFSDDITTHGIEYTTTTTGIPEPSSMILFVLGALGIVPFGRRR